MQLDLSHIVIAILAAMAGAWWTRRRERENEHPLALPPKAPSPPQAAEDVRDRELPIGMIPRLFTIVFMGGWLIAWTAAVLAAFVTFFDGTNNGLFLVGWLIGASAAWLYVAYTIVQLIRGKSPTRQGRWH